ncbi:Card1-like endonuclease domain-containing protein [Aliivibrio kagoshimensis]|uniref:Card1-like endonuclease domain-containing protein n=1 Tax=Aliivibrio kagoshimensis TaxID=2910230 RepID=UPI003D0D8B47
MTVHIGIIDQDPVRLITPLLDESVAGNHMVFIGDASQFELFKRFHDILAVRSITSEFYEIPSVVNTSVIKQSIQDLATALTDRFTTLNFNASCGLRHRLLSAYEVFRSHRLPIFVVEPNSDKLCWLYPDGLSQQHVADNIQLSDYLAIFGARCEFSEEQELNEKLNIQLQDLCQRWASNALELGPGLATLNYLATTCRKEQKLAIELTEKQQGYREVNMLLNDLVDTGLATYANGLLTFDCEEARRFANGEWLENLVHNTVKDIQNRLPTLQDHSLNVQVYRKIGEKDVRNELDVASVVNNKLYIIECKTKGMRDDGDDTLYKLESLRDLLGGLQARAMLVSFRPLRNNDLVRAKDLGLAIIGPDELKNLNQYLFEWFQAAGGQ